MTVYLKYLLGIYILLLLLLLTPRIHGNDGIGYFVYLRSMVFDRDFDFTNEFNHYRDEYNVVGYSPVTGKPVNGVPIGSAILWLPFYLVAHLAVLIINLYHPVWPVDGYSFPYIVAIGISSSFYGFLGLYLIYRIGIRFYDEKIVFPAVFFFWLSTPLVFYMFLHPSMAHANSVFAVSLFLFLWIRIFFNHSIQWPDWALMGLAGGLLTIVRLQDCLFLGMLILLFIFQPAAGYFRRNLLNLVLCLMAFVIAISPQLIAWNAIFGSYFSGPQSHNVSQNMDLFHPRLIQVLFSGRHGLMTWNPILLVGFMGLPVLYRKNKGITLGLIIIFILQLWIISSWREWWGAHSFGHRMFLSSTPLFVLGLCSFLDYCRGKWSIVIYKHSLIWIGLILIVWNFGLMVQYASGIIDRDGTTPFNEVIKNQFIVVPRKLVGEGMEIYSNRFHP